MKAKAIIVRTCPLCPCNRYCDCPDKGAVVPETCPIDDLVIACIDHGSLEYSFDQDESAILVQPCVDCEIEAAQNEREWRD